MFIRIYRKITLIRTRLLSLYWRFLFNKFEEGSKVFGSIKVYSPENVFFGKNSTLNHGVLLNARDKIIIGDNVHISPYVIVNTGGLDYSKTGVNRSHVKKEVVIKDGVWIGSNAIINPGVIIGENSVIGAGAVVTKDVPSNSVSVGVPDEVKKKNIN